MSLFSSTFEKTVESGPSSKPLHSHPPGPHKRKRPSARRDDSGGAVKMESVQANLSKLMKRVSKGEARAGREALLGKDTLRLPLPHPAKKTRPKGTQQAGLQHRGLRRQSQAQTSDDAATTMSQSGQAKGVQPQRAKSEGKTSLRIPEKGTLAPAKTKKTKSKHDSGLIAKSELAPARLSSLNMPIANFPPHESSDEGMTAMQKGMKAKLEGARFR